MAPPREKPDLSEIHDFLRGRNNVIVPQGQVGRYGQPMRAPAFAFNSLASNVPTKQLALMTSS
jgi:hypothetical protein